MTGSRAETEAFLEGLPEGPLGSLGQVVLCHDGQTFRFQVDQWQEQPRQPLGDTGLEVELVQVSPIMLGVQIDVFHGDDPPQPMTLLATLPYMNRQDTRDGVFGAYWLDPQTASLAEAARSELGQKLLGQAEQARIDIVQDPDGQLFYRTWQPPATATAAPWPTEGPGIAAAPGSKIVAFERSDRPIVLTLDEHVARSEPGWEVRPLPFQRPDRMMRLPQSRARLRLTVDGHAEEFWLATAGDQVLPDQQHTVVSPERRVTIRLARDAVDLGFQVFLREFSRKLDPGTNDVSHYSSLVDFLPADGQGKPLQKNVLISLNAPVDFRDPRNGRSYRLYQSSYAGPLRPGDPQFDEIVDGKTPRDRLFQSVLAVNSDPGRGLKYLGCLLGCVGILITFYRGILRRSVLLAIVLCLTSVGPAAAGEQLAPLDLGVWQRMPVFDSGRRMPLESFARAVVKEVCGTADPTIDPSGIPPSGNARRLFPDGKPRRIEASELLLSWLVEPEKWEQIPLFVADDPQLRGGLLGLPLEGDDGRRLRRVSPADLLRAAPFWQRLVGLRQQQGMAQSQRAELEFTGVDAEVVRLWDAFTLYRLVTFDPAAPAEGRGRFLEKLAAAVRVWRDLEPGLRDRLPPTDQPGAEPAIEAFSQSLAELIVLIDEDRLTLDAADPLLEAARRASASLATQMAELRREAFRDPAAGEQERAALNALAASSATLARLADETHMALYDDGRALRLVPALDPAALQADRDLGDDSQPWLSLQTLLLGSDALLQAYPQAELAEFRLAFGRVKTAYCDRDASDRPERFATAMGQFAAATRALGEAIEPLRRQLPIRGDKQDVDAALAATAYPPVGWTDAEWIYDQLNPFRWIWPVCLLATICLAVSSLRVRRALFWTGLAVLALGLAMIVFGLGLRTVITAWVSVTNMFEVIMFVGLSAGVLGLWFTLLPLMRSGLATAWQMAALPGLFRRGPDDDQLNSPLKKGATAGLSSSACEESREDEGTAGQPRSDARSDQPSEVRSASMVRWLVLVPRVALMVGVFVTLAILPVGSGGRPIVSLTPRTGLGSSAVSFSEVLVWAAGLCVLALAVWWLPRLIVAAAASLVSVPMGCRGAGARGLLEEVDRYRLCAGRGRHGDLGHGGGLLCAGLRQGHPPADAHSSRQLLAHGPCVVDHGKLRGRRVGLGAGQRRAGLLPVRPLRRRLPRRPRPARRLCRQALGRDSIAHLQAIQVTVLLLAVGTVLGGLWGDVAWGRFWAWDPKEVWALICLLVYLAVLHARSAGWAGDFGLTLARAARGHLDRHGLVRRQLPAEERTARLRRRRRWARLRRLARREPMALPRGGRRSLWHRDPVRPPSVHEARARSAVARATRTDRGPPIRPSAGSLACWDARSPSSDCCGCARDSAGPGRLSQSPAPRRTGRIRESTCSRPAAWPRWRACPCASSGSAATLRQRP